MFLNHDNRKNMNIDIVKKNITNMFLNHDKKTTRGRLGVFWLYIAYSSCQQQKVEQK